MVEHVLHEFKIDIKFEFRISKNLSLNIYHYDCSRSPHPSPTHVPPERVFLTLI